jgi:hypothetical protein
MLLMVGGVYAVDQVLLTIGRVVGMQFHHGALGRFGICAIDLDLIIALSMEGWNKKHT